jgi:hypothetical protein
MPALRLSKTICRGDIAKAGECADMAANPVWPRLRPACFGIGEVGGARCTPPQIQMRSMRKLRAAKARLDEEAVQ